MHEYEVFAGMPDQHRFIKAQDYDDRVGDCLSRFYACPRCGSYFASKLWEKRAGKWYCQLSWDKWCELADPADVRKVQQAWGDDPSQWPVIGCTTVYAPWKFGQGMVIEYKASEGEWKAFRADLIPEVLDDAIKKRQVEFNTALSCLTPDDVYDLIPRTFPKVSPVALAGFEQFPGLGKFDLEKWVKEDQPVLTTTGWLKLALKVAQGAQDLTEVFETAKSELCKRNEY
jgi:hypothetical protein